MIMKKLLLVLFCALFGFSCAGGGILLAQDLPSMVENDGEGISASLNDEIEAQASGYWSSYYAGSFADGSGTSSDPYLIETAAQLARVAYLSNSSSNYSSYRTDYFELVADIDLSDHYWVPIGRNYSFNGHFNGNYHTISGMTCYVSSSSSSYYTNVADASNGLCAGLFGTLGGSAYVANFALNDVVITTGTSSLNSATFKIGAVAAAVLGTSSSSNVTIFQVNVFGSITDSFSGGGNEERIGGIVGYARNVAIAYCQSYVTISTSSSRGSNSSDSWAWCVGGIVGALEYSGTYVYSCAFLGYINSYLVAGGGIAGVVNDQAKIRCCYAVRGQYYTSSASNYFYLGTRDCGGIVGSLHSNASIVSCWASVDPRHRGSYEYFEGGLAGSISGGGNIYCSMWNSYFITSSYASADSGTRYGITSYSSSNSSYFRRSSSFTTYMRSGSYGENWMSSAWTITSSSSSYGHLNYGFPHITYTRVQN